MPLGYECTIFEKLDRPGGLMRTNIPAFRLPRRVLDEEIGYILAWASTSATTAPVDSMRALLDEGLDAVFIGCGAPKGKELELPGRHESDRSTSASAGCSPSRLTTLTTSAASADHRRGNTAMDCCRTPNAWAPGRAGDRAAVRPHFKASPWELEDAEEEGVIIVENHAPRRFVIENGVWRGWSSSGGVDGGGTGSAESRCRHRRHPLRRVILAIGQEAAFPWIEHDIGIDVDRWGMPVVDHKTFQTTRPGVFVGGDAAWGPENIIWAVEHGHQAAISIHQYLQGQLIAERPAWGMNLVSQKMGMHEWSYGNDYEGQARAKMRHVELVERLRNLEVEVELGFDWEQTQKEAGRCLNCDVQTHFTDALCIECDACIDICPVNCLTIAPNGERRGAATAANGPRAEPAAAALRQRTPAADGAGECTRCKKTSVALDFFRRAAPPLTTFNMLTSLAVHFLPALTSPDELAAGDVVMIDVLRASTTIIHALSAGADCVIPCREVDDARQTASRFDAGKVVLGGERGGLPIPGFHLGNSPLEYTRAGGGGQDRRVHDDQRHAGAVAMHGGPARLDRQLCEPVCGGATAHRPSGRSTCCAQARGGASRAKMCCARGH